MTPQPTPETMTTPHVVEMPRRLESTSPDTFLGDASPLGIVVPLHAREGRAGPRRPRPRRGGPSPNPGLSGPGGDAA